MAYQPVQIVETHKDAKQFLLDISPLGEYFKDTEFSEWVFRGHASHKWELIPSALRSQASNYNEQISREIEDFIAFIKYADLQGLSLTSDSVDLREQILFLEAELSCLKENTTVHPRPLWPPKYALPILGLAQHYKIPTRLLDWSRDPNTAAYFAARDNLFDENIKEDKSKIVIWALNISHLNLINQRFIDFVEPPTAGNPNLIAQKGVFTLFRPEKLACPDRPIPEDEKEKFLPPYVCRGSFEDFAKYIPSDSLAYQKTSTLICFSLDRSAVPELLRLLFNMKVSAATLFPGFGGVAKAVKEKKELAILLPSSDNNGTFEIYTHEEITKAIDFYNSFSVNRPNDQEIRTRGGELVKFANYIIDDITENRKNEYDKGLRIALSILSVLKDALYSGIYDLEKIALRLHKLEPENHQVCFELGRIYSHTAEVEKASQWYKRTIRIVQEKSENLTKEDLHRRINRESFDAVNSMDLYMCGFAFKCLSSLAKDHFNDHDGYIKYAKDAIHYFEHSINLEDNPTIRNHLDECRKRIQDITR